MNIGLLGGTFDPIHEGHLHIARAALESVALDRVLFVVARVPPHKQAEPLTEAWHRFAMVALATQDDPRLLASGWELKRPGAGYTINTLEAFRREQPDDRHCFIAGGDSLKELHLWRECDRLLAEHCFVFVRRPGVTADLAGLELSDSLKSHIQIVCEEKKPSIQPGKSFLVLADPPPVSSTQIREAIAAGGRPDPGHLSPRVLAHIQKYRLYEQNQRRAGQGLRSHQQ